MFERVFGVLIMGGAVAALGCQAAGGGGLAAGPLASGQSGVRALAVNGAYVYWTMTSGSVRRVPVDGGAVDPRSRSADGGKVETVADGLHIPDQLAVDDTDVYLSTLDGRIVRVEKTGGAPTPLADAQNDVVGVQLDDVYVYWATRDGHVLRLAKNGGSKELIATAPQGLTSIAKQGEEVYWTAGETDNGVLDSVSANGNAAVTTLVQGLGSPRQLVVAPSSAFWAATIDTFDPMTDETTTTTGIAGAALDGSNVRTISSDAGQVAALTGDDTTLFVATGGGMADVAFSSLAAGGGGTEPVSFATGPAGTPSLALDETSVYWTSSGDGNIFSLPKAATTTESP